MTTPQPQSYDVAAMVKHFYRPPWEQYDGYCDDEGRCWFGSPALGPVDGAWVLRKPSERLGHHTVSLPWCAIPVPHPPHTPSQQP